jgi:hypothetical protein
MKSLLCFLADLFKELGEMALLILKKLNLMLSFLGLDLLALSISFLDCLDLWLELWNFIFKFSFFMLELLDGFF